MNIAYYEEYKDVVSSGSYKQTTWRGKRKELTEKYSWAIPNAEAITFLSEESSEDQIIEIGAGSGYWAHLIQEAGGEVMPIDIQEYAVTWTDITVKGYTELDKSQVTNILLCWPPADDPMGLNAVQDLQPSTVYFVGIQGSSITGNLDFHKFMETEYSVYNRIEIPSWSDNTAELIKYKKL